MNISLRSKLLLLVAVALSLAALPIISFSHNHLLRSGIERERASFANTVMLLEDNLHERYLALMFSEARMLMHKKQGFLQEAAILETLLRDNRLDYGVTLENWHKAYLEDGSNLDLFDMEGKAYFRDPFIAALTQKGKLDFKGQPMHEKIGSDSSRRENVVSYLWTSVGGQQPFLVTFYPLKGLGCLVFSVSLEAMQKSFDTMESQLLDGLQSKISELSLCEGGSISLVDSEGGFLVGKGEPLKLSAISDEVLANVRSGQVLEGVTQGEKGEFLYRLSYFKALDWYVVAAAPMESISAPVRELTRKLVLVALCMMVASLLIMLAFTARTLAPLRQLTGKAQQLASEDFSSESGLSPSLTEGLSLERKDEVGQMARAFAHMVAALGENIRRLKETLAVRQRMEGELRAASDIQMGILPPPESSPRTEDFVVASFLDPAKEVGGDLYDFFTAPDGRHCVVIGDVSDKGVPAALFMSMTVTLVRYAMAEGISCAEAMTRINDRLAENNPSCMFVTLFIGLFDPATGKLEYASGGHCPPFVVNPDASVPVRALTEISGPIVGAMEGMEYTDCHAELAPGEYCLLYTDGVSEAMNEAKEMFTEEALAGVLDHMRQKSPGEVIEGVLEAVEEHRGTAEQSDDITMLCFKRI